MKHLRPLLAVALLALFAGTAQAAGSLVTTSKDVGQGITKYSIAWTSDAGGAVSGNTLTIQRGRLLHVEFVPGSGGTQPTDLYDVVLNDANTVDLLNDGSTACGGNLSNATSKICRWDPPFFFDAATSLDLVISNAGNAKTGTVILWVGP